MQPGIDPLGFGGYVPVVPTQQPSQRMAGTGAKKPEKKKRNFWIDQISTLTGTLGGIGGGILGAAAGGVGSVPGAAAGGAAGAALGESIEQLITPGTGGRFDVAKEAALGGIFGGGPIKLGKLGVQTAGKALGKQVAGEGVELATRTAGQRTAQTMLGNAWGLKTGAKVGSNVLTPQKARSLSSFVSREVGVPTTASADMVAERLVNFKTLAGQNIDDVIKSSDRVLTTKETGNLVGAVNGQISKLAGIDPKNPLATRLTQQLQQKKTLKELVEFRRSLDDTINFARNPVSPDPVAERIASAMRSEIDKKTSALIPGLKTANSQYSKAAEALDYVLPNARAPRGINIGNNRIGGTQAQRAQAAMGQIGARLGGMGQGAVTTSPGAITRNMVGQNLMIPRGQMQEPQGDMGLEGALFNNQMAQPMGMDSSMGAPEPEQSPYSRANLMADIQRDPKNADKYVEYYAMLQEVFTPKDEKQKPMSQGQQERADLIKALGLAEDSVNMGSINYGPIGSRIEGIKASLNMADPETLAFRNTISGLRAAITKARAGASLTEGEMRLLNKYTPSDTDSEQVVRSKLAALRNLYGYQMPQGGGTLEDALFAQQQQFAR